MTFSGQKCDSCSFKRFPLSPTWRPSFHSVGTLTRMPIQGHTNFSSLF
uniref:Uncharacterized protein n=1 Tax=Arundo donax TaxID=35708 RepID=A0A0A9CMY3_ARUDO